MGHLARHHLSRARRVALVVMGAFGLLAAGTAVYAAAMKPSFELSLAAAKATSAPGGATGYAVDVKRVHDFRAPVTLRLSGLPANATAVWKLPDGRTLPRSRGSSAVVLPASASRAFVVVTTKTAVKTGTYRPVITASGRSAERRKRAQLTIASGTRFSASSSSPQADAAASVLPSSIRVSRAITLVASPAAGKVYQGDSTTFSIAITRAPGVHAVNLSVSGLPAGAKATFTPSSVVEGDTATLAVETDAATPPRAYDLTITGTVGGARSTAAATLDVAKTIPFGIAGDLAAPLVLGSAAPIDVVITNPYEFALTVTELTATVSTTQPGCSADDFVVRPAVTPLVVEPGTHHIADPAKRPTITFVNRPVNQDACKGAPLKLTYAGVAGR